MPDAPVASPVGGIIKSLPIGAMIGEPVRAMIDADQMAKKAYADFIQAVGFVEEVDAGGKKRSSVRMVRGSVRQLQRDKAGNPTNTILENVVDVPLLSLILPRPFGPSKGRVEFDMTVETSDMSSSSTEGKAEFEAKVGWGPFSASFKGSLSHKSEQTRKTDTRARYAFWLEMDREEAPEGLQRFNDFLMNAAMQGPVPAAAALPLPGEAKAA